MQKPTNFPIPSAKNPDNLEEQFLAFIQIVKLLRLHCPWDREQTNESIAPLLIEEAYETIEAIEHKNWKEFSKELGDLLLHIVMHSIIAEEQGSFCLLDVLKEIQKKLIFRHPHVFGNIEVNGVSEVLKNWEELKKQEGKKSILEGVPKSLPALLRAERIQEKVSKVGFDWEKPEEVCNKIIEEINELHSAIESKRTEAIEEEFGDLLFTIVNYARFMQISPEIALQKSNNKFIRRFQSIEEFADNQNKSISEMKLNEMDQIWNDAKLKEQHVINSKGKSGIKFFRL